MTITIIILLSLLSTFIMFWTVTTLVNEKLSYFFNNKDEIYVIFNLGMAFILVIVFLVTYFAMNNTFFHFKY